MLLLKDVDDRGRVFYPHLVSRKARHQCEVYTRQVGAWMIPLLAP
jgi:pyridoxine/pyridoxamine 5'-phosphate oxidase